jgi:hypothetical protein
VTAGGTDHFEQDSNTGNVDLPDVKFLDQVDSRLQVTNVSATKGSRVQNSDPQNVGWLIPVLGVGESVDIVIYFSVLGTASPDPNVSKTGKISGVYTDDNGRRAIIEEKDTDSIDVVEMTSVPTMSCPPVTCPPVDDISCAPSAALVSRSPPRVQHQHLVRPPSHRQ